MAIGISQARNGVLDAPGTCLFDPPAQVDEGADLKRLPGDQSIILRPQPTNSPNDPLNWSRARKELLYFTLLLGSCAVGVIGPLVVPALASFIAIFDRPLPAIVSLNGYLVLSYGIASLLVVVLADVTGRRPLYLGCAAILLASMVWAAKADAFASLLWARIVQGIGMGAYGCLGNLTITDVFFLHEQGWRIAVWQLSFNGTIAITPVISGVVIEKLGWRTSFLICAALQAVVVVLTIVAFPETAYRRTSNTSSETEADMAPVFPTTNMSQQQALRMEKSGDAIATSLEADQASVTERSASLLDLLRPWRKIQQSEAISIRLSRPVVVLLSPAVFYSMLLYTFSFSWFVVAGSIFAQIFAAPPYNLTPASIGYITGIGPFIGVTAALLASGPLADYAARFLSRRNDGYFEPEMRLILVIPGFISFVIGVFGWAFELNSGNSPYWGPAVFIAFMSAGQCFLLVAAISYSASAYPARGGDTFGIIMVLKAIWAWGATRFVNNWLVEAGPIKFFLPLAAITMGVALAGIPMWIYGKRLRAWSTTTWFAWALQ